MTANSKETTEKTSKKRLFQEGGPGGPGRGHKNKPDDSPVKPVTMADIENALQPGLSSKDPKIRQGAGRILIAALKQAGKLEANDNIIDPWVLDLIGFLRQMQANIHEGTGQDVTGLDVIRKMSKVCLTCEKIGAVDASFKEVDQDFLDE